MPVRVFVDQGHSPFDSHTDTRSFGLRKQDITYITGAYLADILKADPVFEVGVSRQNPNEILGYNSSSNLSERVNMANAWNADYFISIQVGNSENPDINGTEASVYAENTPAYYLAKSIVEEIANKVGTNHNNIHIEPSYDILRNTKMPAISINLAYITNLEDSILISNAPYPFAHAIYTGLLSHLDSTVPIVNTQ